MVLVVVRRVVVVGVVVRRVVVEVVVLRVVVGLSVVVVVEVVVVVDLLVVVGSCHPGHVVAAVVGPPPPLSLGVVISAVGGVTGCDGRVQSALVGCGVLSLPNARLIALSTGYRSSQHLFW